MSKSYIYKLTDLRNGKIYIGQHNGKNSKYVTGGIIPNNIIKDHGEGVFGREIIIQGNFNKELLNQLEKHYIRLFAAKIPEIGYNLTDGGDSFDGYVMSEKHKLRISESHIGDKNPMYGRSGDKHPRYGKGVSEETKQKISNTLMGKMSGEKNPNYGKNFSKEHKRKLSEAHRGHKHTEEHKRKISQSLKGKRCGKNHHNFNKPAYNRKTVYQYDLDDNFINEWSSVTQVEKDLKIKHVSCTCLGKQKTAGGFKWKYAKIS